MKKVGNFLIDLDRYLGQGQYGKVYLAQEIPEASPLMKNANTTHQSSGDTITKAQQSLQ